MTPSDQFSRSGYTVTLKHSLENSNAKRNIVTAIYHCELGNTILNGRVHSFPAHAQAERGDCIQKCRVARRVPRGSWNVKFQTVAAGVDVLQHLHELRGPRHIKYEVCAPISASEENLEHPACFVSTHSMLYGYASPPPGETAESNQQKSQEHDQFGHHLSQGTPDLAGGLNPNEEVEQHRENLILILVPPFLPLPLVAPKSRSA